MMEERFNDREFGRFLRENADKHRLYPSEQVWNNIHARLYSHKNWYASPLSILMLTALIITSVMLRDHGAEKTIVKASVSHNLLTSNSTLPLRREYHTNPTIVDEKEVHHSNLMEAPTRDEKTATSYSPTVNWPTIAVPDASNITMPAAEAKEIIQAKEGLVNKRGVEAFYPLTIESVTNSYAREKYSPKFRYQLHFTPTISYRSLKENVEFISQARMNLGNMAAVATPELSRVIKHRPDVGMQLGISGTYPLGKRIDWVTGLQFNVSKYDIKAFNYPSEVATIALVNSWGGPTPVTTLTSFRSNGFMNRASWLRNYYYSFSLPMGLEWRVLGKKNNYWGVSATAQPTYVIGNRSYIISMDYQNYAEVPYLIRKWNLNLGLETYARFQIGARDFKLGPQFRYQVLSSFINGYPVQEHLYDFGFKLGMVLGK